MQEAVVVVLVIIGAAQKPRSGGRAVVESPVVEPRDDGSGEDSQAGLRQYEPEEGDDDHGGGIHREVDLHLPLPVFLMD